MSIRTGLSAALIALAPLAAVAQQPTVGLLHYGERDRFEPVIAAFREGLAENGFVEGKNLRIEYRFARNDHHKLERLAGELAGLKVGVIFAYATPSVHAAKAATRSIPIVFTQVADPVVLGFVESLARPGGNITGLSWANEDLVRKRLELLRDALPKLRRVALLYDEQQARACRVELDWLDLGAAALGIQLARLPFTDRAEIPAMLARAKSLRGEAVISPVTISDLEYTPEIIAGASGQRIAVMYGNPNAAGEGGLFAFGPDYRWANRRAGYYVARILKGAKPAELPVEQPMRYELAVNLKTARAQGITIPPVVLVRATRVIE